MSDLFLLLLGVGLGVLLKTLWDVIESEDSTPRDYGYDSRTGERSDNEVRMQKPPAPITVRNRRRTGERNDRN